MAQPMIARVARNGLIAILLLPAAACATDCCVGTYSTLAYNQESGDLNGLEMTFIPTDSGLTVSVQVAEDGINELHIAKVKEDEGKLVFSITLDDDSTVQFSMVCSLASCTGEYVWGQARVHIALPKNQGYWNRNRSG